MGEKGRQMLDVLMTLRNEWATECVYCGRTIVNTRLMPEEYKPAYCGHDKVSFFIKGRRYTALRATADHYFDRCYGGRSTLNNILPACQPCNNGRSFGREWPLCIDCTVRRRIYKKRCFPCQQACDLRVLENDRATALLVA